MKNRLFVLFLFVFCSSIQNGIAQHFNITSLKVSEVQASFVGKETVYWAIPITNDRRIPLTWKIKKTSFSDKGIFSYVAYDNDRLKATLTISKDNVYGSYFSEEEIQVSGKTGGFLKVSVQPMDAMGCHTGCRVHEELERVVTTKSRDIPEERRLQGLSDNLLRKFRLAILISPYVYKNRHNSNIASVRTQWASIETQLNEIYGKEVGIQFNVIDDEKLILKNYDRDIDTQSSGSEMSNIQSALEGILTSKNYDIGFGMVKNLRHAAGVAHLNGVYRNSTKGRAVIGSSSSLVMAHELGHLFGATHTFEVGGNYSNYTEPGRGYSLMSYGVPRTFFSITSLRQIRSGIMGMPYYTTQTSPSTGNINSVFAIANSNHTPVIREKYDDRYVIPPKTFFGFSIDAYDPDGDKLLYAVHQSDQKKAATVPQKPSENNRINFQKGINEHYFTQYDFDQRTAGLAGHDLSFYLMAFDAISEQENHSTQLSTQKVFVNIKRDAKPFKINNLFQASYKAGDKIELKWDVDNTVFDQNSKVRILLSTDLGKTFTYVLDDKTENDGSHIITLPNINIKNEVVRVVNSETQTYEERSFPAGVIKVEVLDHIAYSVSARYPFNATNINTFSLQALNPMNNEKQLQIYTGNDKTLANISLSESVTWYDALESGNTLPLHTALVDEETYYAQVSGQETRFGVRVKRISENEQELCDMRFSRMITTPSEGAVLRWFENKNSELELEKHVVIEEGIYYVEEYLENSQYVSNRVPVSIKSFKNSSLPVVEKTNIEYEVGDVASPLEAIASNGNSLVWSFGKHKTSIAPTPSTKTLGTFIFFVSQVTSSGCESDDVKIIVKVKEKKMPPKADIPDILFPDSSVVYDGSVHSLSISGELPQGCELSYVNNGHKSAGIYEVIANISGGANYNDRVLKASLSILKADILDILFPDSSVVYDGSAHSLSISGELPQGCELSYVNNGHKSAGIYEVIANISGGANYNDRVLKASLNILKADIPDILFPDFSVVYDGSAHSLSISGELPQGCELSYVNNGHKSAGIYEVIANISGGANYNDRVLKASLNILKADIPDILFPDFSVVYDGSAHSLSISGELPQGCELSYINNGHKSAGIYEVIANISGGANYNDRVLKASLNILKADIPDILFSDSSVVYDGSAHSLSISGELPQGCELSYVNNGHKSAGIYEVIANISGGANYNDRVLKASLNILKADIPDILFPDSSVVYDGSAHSLSISGELPQGCELSYVNNGHKSAGVYEVIANISGGANYNDRVLKASLRIKQKDLTVSAKEQSKTYGESDPVFVYTVTPKLLGKDRFTGVLNRERGESAGNYRITQGSLSAGGNYNIKFVESIFEILKPAIVANDDKVKVFADQTVVIDVAENDLIGKMDIHDNNYRIVASPIYGTVKEKTDGVFEYKAAASFVGEDYFTYSLCDKDSKNCQVGTVRIQVEIADMHYDFSVENFITPNRDGYNDKWFIAGLVKSLKMKLKNKVLLFNSLGKLVFEKINYMYDDELFVGYSNKGNSEKLKAGVYFYIIEVDSKKRKSGFLYLMH